MEKEDRLIFLRVFMLVIFIFFASTGVFLYKHRYFGEGITGFSIKDVSKPKEIAFSSKIFLIVQWALLLLALLVAFLKDQAVKSRKEELKGINLLEISKENGTDLDALYALLQDKKQLNISTIAKTFNVNNSIAMQWCKTLESGDLAIIDYPAAKEPLIKIK